MMQLRKISNHPYQFLECYPVHNPEWIYMSSGKFELLDRMLPKILRMGHKVLIFSQFVQLISIMCAFFDYRGIKHLKLDGAMHLEQRNENLKKFQDVNSDYKVFILSTRAGGQGLNLQEANTVIIFDSDWNPQMDRQAEDRAHRIGQKHEVRVYRLITMSRVEEGILSKAEEKKDLDELIIQAGGFGQKQSDIDRQQKLKDLVMNRAGEVHTVNEEGDEEGADEIYTDEQLNEIISRNDEEFEIFQKMDQERYAQEDKAQRLALIREKKPTKAHLPDEKINYRLIQDWEVPDWIHQSVEEEKVVDPLLSTGKRLRKEVNYKEMSDSQAFKMFEEGVDPN